MNSILTVALLSLLFVSTIGFYLTLKIAIRLFNANASMYDEVRALLIAPDEKIIKGFIRSFKGQIIDSSAEGRSYLKTAGVGLDLKTNEVVFQAKPSKEAVKRYLTPSR